MADPAGEEPGNNHKGNSKKDPVIPEPGELIPANLIIGKITKIISAQQEPLQKAEVRLETNLRDNPSGLVIILQP